MTKIAAGYRFIFQSEDIRNENSSTIIKEGCSEDEAKFFRDLSEQITGGTYLDVMSSHPQWRIKKEHEKLSVIFEKYSSLFTQEQMENFKNDVGTMVDFIAENMIGYSHEEGINMRVLKSYQIEEVPHDIIINDITHSFKKKL